jgi:hypothetical protein
MARQKKKSDGTVTKKKLYHQSSFSGVYQMLFERGGDSLFSKEIKRRRFFFVYLAPGGRGNSF